MATVRQDHEDNVADEHLKYKQTQWWQSERGPQTQCDVDEFLKHKHTTSPVSIPVPDLPVQGWSPPKYSVNYSMQI